MIKMSFTIRSICKVLLIQLIFLIPGYQLRAQDTDSDGVANATDLDDDNDGITDVQEGFLKLTDFKPPCGTAATPDFSGTANLVTGTAKQVGAVYRISKVLAGTDALIEIEAMQNIADLVIDDNSADQKSFRPQTSSVNMPNGGEAYTQYKITFVSENTTTPVKLASLYANFSDHDGNATREGEIIWLTDHAAYVHQAQKDITFDNFYNSNNLNWTKVTAGTQDVANIDTTAKAVAFTARYAGISSFRVRFGVVARQLNAGTISRVHRVDFTCPLNYTNPETYIVDFDEDGIINTLDLDSDNDGISDVAEAGGADTDNNGLIGTGTGVAIADANANGLANAVDAANGGTALILTNTDTDVNPDFLDTDSDGDGISDIIEAQATASFVALSGNDADKDGIDDAFDLAAGFKTAVNTDGTDLPDYKDLNSDNDTQTDAIEGWDTDNNGTANVVAAGKDGDRDGLDDAFDANDVVINIGNAQTPQSFPNLDKAATAERDWREVYVSIPVANADNVTATEDTPLEIVSRVLANDVTSDDGPSATVPFVITVQPLHGTIKINNNGTPANPVDDIVTYEPALNYSGPDSFIYKITDLNGDNDTALVKVTVSPVNDKPIVDRESLVIDEDTQASGNLIDGGDSDVEGSALVATVNPLVAPQHGTIKIETNGAFVYTPVVNFNGTDLIVTEVCDTDPVLPKGCSNDTIFVTVNPVNDKPVLDLDEVTVIEDNNATGDVTNAGDSDPDGTELVYTSTLVQPKHGKIEINGSGVFTYSPALNFSGKDTIVVNVCDQGIPLPAACASNTIIVTVTPVNDKPVAADITRMTNPSQLVKIKLSENVSDVDSDVFTYSILSKNDPAATASVAADGELSYTPTGNGQIRVDELTYVVCDNAGACDTAKVFINVPSVPVPPVPSDDQVTSAEDSPVTKNVTENDSDPNVNIDITSVTIKVNPKHGAAFVDAPTGKITYTPVLNYNGKDTIVYSICDLTDSCATAKVIYTLTPVNDKPVAGEDLRATDPEVTLSYNVGENDSDVDGDDLKFRLLYFPAGTAASIDEESGLLTYTPTADGTARQDSLVYEIRDGGNPELKDTAVILITIPNLPVPPSPKDDILQVNEDSQGSVQVSANDRDVNGNLDPNSIKIKVNPKKGTASADAATGFITYTPAADFFGKDTLVYEISDKGGLTSLAKVLVTVNPVNDKPVAFDDTAAVNPGATVIIKVAANDKDIDNTSGFTFSILKSPAQTSATINAATGDITYVPTTDRTLRRDTIVYKICDLGGLCDEGQVLVRVPYPDTAPVAANDVVSTDEDTQKSIDVTANDTDVNDDINKSSVTIFKNPLHGTVTIETATGVVIYNPAKDFYGKDSLEYIVYDLTSRKDTAKVIIVINPVNDAPVLENERVSLDEDTQLSGTIFTAADKDPEGTLLEASTIVRKPAHGSITVSPSGAFVYTPDPNYFGSDIAVVKVLDKGLPEPASANDTIFITVRSVNDPPVVEKATSGADPGNTVEIPVAGNVTDPDKETVFRYVFVSQSDQTAFAQLDESTGILTYRPSTNAAIRTDVVNYRVCDAANSCVAAQILIDVPNRSFRARNDSATINEDVTVNVHVLVNDTTFNVADTTTLNLLTLPLHGTASVNRFTGIITYVPQTNYFGKDTLTYNICQYETGVCKSAKVFFNILSVNDLDVANDTYVAAIGLPAITGNFLDNDLDPEGTGVAAKEVIVRKPQYGTFTFSTDGNFSYLPSDKAFSLTDTVVTEVCDNGMPLPGLCKKDTIFFVIKQNQFVADGFTPNGDGINDYFIIETIIPGNISLQVFNRWGSLVYKNENYKNDWDGKSNQGLTVGEFIPEGTYYYEVKFGNGEIKRNHITILK